MLVPEMQTIRKMEKINKFSNFRIESLKNRTVIYHSIDKRKLANNACDHIGVLSCNAFIVEFVRYERIV